VQKEETTLAHAMIVLVMFWMVGVVRSLTICPDNRLQIGVWTAVVHAVVRLGIEGQHSRTANNALVVAGRRLRKAGFMLNC